MKKRKNPDKTPKEETNKPENELIEEKKKKNGGYEIQDIETYHDAFMKYE